MIPEKYRKPKATPIDVEGFGSVFVRRLSLDEYAAAIRAINAADTPEDRLLVVGKCLVAPSLVDAYGNREIPDTDLGEAGQLDAGLVRGITPELYKINGITFTAREELEKNSEPTPSGSPNSD
jgi:hypothetical protein